MHITENQLKELRVSFAARRATLQIRGESYPAKEAFDVLAPYALVHGAPDAASSWDVAIVEARAAGEEFTMHKPAVQKLPIPNDFQDQINKLTPGQLRIKITPPQTVKGDVNDLRSFSARDYSAGGYDEQFADWFSRWSAGERPEGTVAGKPFESFSAKDWKSIPAQRLAVMMNDPAFRARIEHIVTHGDQNGERI